MKKVLFLMLMMVSVAGYAQSGVTDALIGIFKSYQEALGAAESKSQYVDLSSEMLSKIGELEKQYPDYEPTDAEMDRISATMEAFNENDAKLRERFGVLTAEEEAEATAAAETEALAEKYLEIEDLNDRALTLLTDYTENLKEVSTQEELLDLITELESVSTLVLPDGFEPSEDRAEELSEAGSLLGTVVGMKIREFSE